MKIHNTHQTFTASTFVFVVIARFFIFNLPMIESFVFIANIVVKEDNTGYLLIS